MIDLKRTPNESREWALGHVPAGKEVFQSETVAVGTEYSDKNDAEELKENNLLRFKQPAK